MKSDSSVLSTSKATELLIDGNLGLILYFAGNAIWSRICERRNDLQYPSDRCSNRLSRYDGDGTIIRTFVSSEFGVSVTTGLMVVVQRDISLLFDLCITAEAHCINRILGTQFSFLSLHQTARPSPKQRQSWRPFEHPHQQECS